MNICILIPAHNESKTIGSLVASLKKKGFPVVVINDGSIDDSGLIAKREGAYVIDQSPKQGKGYSLQRGFEYVLRQGYDGVVIMDGDGQHSVSDLDQFLPAGKNSNGAIIVGNRMANSKNMPRLRYVTNKVMSFLISLLCRQKVPDTQCGYRYIPQAILKDIKLKSCDFEIESEILTCACRKGYKIVSVPIQTIYQGEESYIHPLKDTIRFLSYFFKEIFRRH